MRRPHRATRLLGAVVVSVAVLVVAGVGAQEGATSVVPADRRLGPLRNLDGIFPFEPHSSREAWQSRAEALRRQVRVSLGLWPWPTRTPLNAVVHGKVAREGYTVERVFFESVPGHFVTGSLYRPTGRTGRLPAVLSPHGHWPGGRFQDVAPDERQKQLASGAEMFDNGARHPLQARAVQLARMGAVVFLYDMEGYADSAQIAHAIAHRGPDQTPGDAGLFYSVEAEGGLQSIMGLQIWNAIRALDWLTALPDVDPHRIAITGASGGGTQTFITGAIDERPSVLFPAVMVSTRMQGGCTCENATYLRVGTGNIELAALLAPRPLGMTAADDWTRHMETEGFPELRKHYAMLGVPDKVRLFPYLQFEHNYNAVSRAAMYGWLNTHLRLGVETPVRERDFVPLTREEATVWTNGHAAPTGGGGHEKAITRWWRDDATRQLAALTPRDRAGLEKFRELVGGAVAAIIGRGVPNGRDIEATSLPSQDAGRAAPHVNKKLRWAQFEEQVDVAHYQPRTPGSTAVVWVRAGGNRFTDAAPDTALLSKWLGAGYHVLVPEPLRGHASAQPLVENRRSGVFTFGYNSPLVVERAHDVLATLAYARTSVGPRGRVVLVALDRASAGPAVLALAQAGKQIDAAAMVPDGFRFEAARSIDDPSFLPGGTKYGDLPGLLALAAPVRLWVAGEPKEKLAVVEAAYRAAGAENALTLSATVPDVSDRGVFDALSTR